MIYTTCGHVYVCGVCDQTYKCRYYLQIKPKRSSGDAEENILRFLQACTTLGVKKVSRMGKEGRASLLYKIICFGKVMPKVGPLPSWEVLLTGESLGCNIRS